MIRISIFISFLFASFFGDAFSQDIEGVWIGTDEKSDKPVSLVKIYIEDGKLYGNIIKLLDEEEARENPLCTKCEGELKDQPIAQIRIIHGLEKIDGKWDGKNGILDPYKGKFHNVRVWVEHEELKVRGYMGPFFRTLSWKRARESMVRE
jgi:hypothetical protein